MTKNTQLNTWDKLDEILAEFTGYIPNQETAIRMKASIITLINDAVVAARIDEVHRCGYAPVSISYPEYAKHRIATLTKGAKDEEE